MPIDFKKIVSDAHTTNELEEQSKREAVDRAQNERNEKTASDVSALQNAMSAHVEKARMEFGENGIQLDITEEFDVANRGAYVMPHIKIHTLSPKRRSDGYQGGSIPVFFSSDSEKLFVSYGKSQVDQNPSREVEKEPLGDHERSIQKAFEFLANKHFEMLNGLPGYPKDFVT